MNNAILALAAFVSITAQAQPHIDDVSMKFWELAWAGNTEAVKSTDLATIDNHTIGYAAKEAAVHGWIDMLEYLLSAKMFDPKDFVPMRQAPMDAGDHKQWLVDKELTYLLQQASAAGQIEVMQLLFKHGAKTEDTGLGFGCGFKKTPLMAAAEKGQVAAVKLLLAKGANAKCRLETSRHNAYDFAYENGHTEVMSIDGLRTRSKYVPDWFPRVTRYRIRNTLLGTLTLTVAALGLPIVKRLLTTTIIIRVPVLVPYFADRAAVA